MRILFLLLAALPAFGQLQTITHSNLTTAAGGIPFRGRVTVTLNSPQAAQPLYYLTTPLAGYRITYCIGLTRTDGCTVSSDAGELVASLYANTTITPAGTSYNARYVAETGDTWNETWTVSVGDTSLIDIRSTTAPAPTTLFQESQLRLSPGSLAYGASTGLGTELAPGSNGHVLTLSGGYPTWAAATVPSLDSNRLTYGFRRFFAGSLTSKTLVLYGNSTVSHADTFKTALAAQAVYGGALEGMTVTPQVDNTAFTTPTNNQNGGIRSLGNIINYGNNGCTLDDMISGSVCAYYPISAVCSLAPDGLILRGGLINDVRQGGTNLAQATALLTAALTDITTCSPNTDILLTAENSLTTTDTGPGYVVPNGSAQAYSDILRKAVLAQAGLFDNVYILDLQTMLYGSVSPATSRYMNDQLHPNSVGQQAEAELIAEVLLGWRYGNASKAPTYQSGALAGSTHASPVLAGVSALGIPVATADGVLGTNAYLSWDSGNAALQIGPRLRIGSADATRPGLRGTSTLLEVMLADFSGYTNIYANRYISQTGFSSNDDFGWVSKSVMKSPADGKITLYNAANTGFSFLQLGGTSASFPSLKVSGADLHLRLADDSGYANLTANTVTAALSGNASTATLATSASALSTTFASGQVLYGQGTGVPAVDADFTRPSAGSWRLYGSAGASTFIVRAGSAQSSANLLEFRSSADSLMSAVRSDGVFMANSGIFDSGDNWLKAGTSATSRDTFQYKWTNSGATGTADVALSRFGIAKIGVTNGTAIGTTTGNAADILARSHYAIERSSDPSAADLTIAGSNTQDVAAIYVKNDKLVVAYNRSGTVNYLTIPLDGSTTTFTQSTSAP